MIRRARITQRTITEPKFWHLVTIFAVDTTEATRPRYSQIALGLVLSTGDPDSPLMLSVGFRNTPNVFSLICILRSDI